MEWVGEIVGQQKMRTRPTPNLIQPHHSADERAEARRGEDVALTYAPVLIPVRTGTQATSHLNNAKYF